MRTPYAVPASGVPYVLCTVWCTTGSKLWLLWSKFPKFVLGCVLMAEPKAKPNP